MKDLLDRGLRALMLFVVVWGFLITSNFMACRKVHGKEMESTITGNSWTVMKPVRAVTDLQVEQIVHFQMQGPRDDSTDYVSRIKGLPGQEVTIPYALSTYMGADKEEKIKLLVPRDCVVVIGDNASMVEYDTRRLGPIRFFSIDGKKD